MKNCKECGAPLKENAQFCGACGVYVIPEVLTRKCTKCGAEIEEGERFCSVCGLNLAEVEDSTKFLAMCCPQCGNKNLKATTEIGSIATVGGYDKGIYGGMSAVTNVNFWICPKCGKKFRHLDGLRKEIESDRKFSDIMYVIGGFIAFIFFLFLVGGSISTGIICGTITFIVFFLPGFIVGKRASKNDNLLNELEEGMRKFQ